MMAGIYALVPRLVRAGALSLFAGYNLFYFLPFSLLLLPALVAHRREGRPPTWAALRQRFWLGPMGRGEWVWVLAVFATFVFTSALLFPTRAWLLEAGGFGPPDLVPAWLDPRVVPPLVWTEFMGVPVAGRYGLLPFYLILLATNWLGEVLWLRGVFLPRQEIRWGRWAWVVNGSVAGLFYGLLWPWNLVAGLPANLALSLMIQARRNTTPALVVYAAVNLIAMLPLFLGICSR